MLDTNSNVLYNGNIAISNLGGAGAPGGADFWGIYATGGTTIGRVEITEGDNDAQYPDANIGFDSLRYGSEVPEPGSLMLMAAGAGLVGLGKLRGAKKA